MIENIELAITRALSKITNPRFFETERGFQGEFKSKLESEIGKELDPNSIFEEEYQKIIKHHGLRLRPDLIIHNPFHQEKNPDRRHGNHIAFAFKLKSNQKSAQEDFQKLDKLIGFLNFELGVFININSRKTFYETYTGDRKPNIRCFAVEMLNDAVRVLKSPE
jgi:hypothetical protein